MNTCIKKISEIIFIFTLVLSFISCKPQVVVTDTTAPGSVTNVNAESEEGKIILTWTDPSDSDLLGIKIYNGTEVPARAVSFSDGILVGKGIQRYEVTNLEDGKKYTFRISAVDNALNESKSVVTNEVKFSLKVVEVSKYVCPKDKKEFATAEEAANCCGVQTVEKEVTVYKYVCPKDKKEFATAQEAAGCCGVQIEYVDKEVEKIVKKYVCPRDGNEYETAEDAEECCGPVVDISYKYVCPKDKKEFSTPEEAANCCGIQYETIKKYICPEDNKEYDNIEDAKNCCGHIHIFDSVYSYDTTYHWKKALCKHSDVVYGKDTHNWDSGIVVKAETVAELGQKKYTCVDCKVEKIEDYNRKTYSITYKNWIDTEGINPTQYTIADNIVLANPTKPNYIFAGWYLDSEYAYKIDKSWEAGTYNKNLVLYAKWLSDTVTLGTINSSTSEYLGLNVYLEFNITCRYSNNHHIRFVYGSQSEILISGQAINHTSHNVTTKNNYIIDGNSSASLQLEKYFNTSGWVGYSDMSASEYTVKLILAE